MSLMHLLRQAEPVRDIARPALVRLFVNLGVRTSSSGLRHRAFPNSGRRFETCIHLVSVTLGQKSK
jgi:hypothetical protein